MRQLFFVAVFFLAGCIDQHQETNPVLSGMDTGTLPGDDFYTFVNGKWQNEQNPDLNGVSDFSTEVNDSIDEHLLKLIEDHVHKGDANDPIKRTYEQYNNWELRDSLGLEPLYDEWAILFPDTASLEWVLAKMYRRGYDVPLSSYLEYRSGIYHTVLSGLRKRKSYLHYYDEILRNSTSKEIKPVINEFFKGKVDIDSLVERYVSINQLRFKEDLGFGHTTSSQNGRKFLLFDTQKYNDLMGYTAVTIEPSSNMNLLYQLQKYSRDEIIQTLKAQVLFENLMLLDSSTAAIGRNLDENFTKRKFRFHFIRELFHWNLAKDYEREYQSDKHKEVISGMISQIQTAYIKQVNESELLTPKQKEVLRDRITSIVYNYTSPESKLLYRELPVKDNLVSTIRSQFEQAFLNYSDYLLEGGDTRQKYDLDPWDYNISYQYSRHQVTIGYQFQIPPYFNPDADMSVNYGALGFYIAHEIGHALDNESFTYDLVMADSETLRLQRKRTESQFSNYEIPSVGFVDGELSLDENISDILGIKAAHDAFITSKYYDDTRRINGFDQRQMFFISRAYVERTAVTLERTKYLIKNDEHAFPNVRINGSFRNVDAFYSAFDISEENKLFLEDSARIVFW